MINLLHSFPLAALVAFILLTSTSDQGGNLHPLQVGSVSKYAPGVMPRVLEWRHTNGIPSGFDPYQDYDGYIATMFCKDVGRVVSANLMIDGTWHGPYRFLVSDCTEDAKTHYWMVVDNIAAELDNDTWQRIGIVDGQGAWIEYRFLD